MNKWILKYCFTNDFLMLLTLVSNYVVNNDVTLSIGFNLFFTSSKLLPLYEANKACSHDWY